MPSEQGTETFFKFVDPGAISRLHYSAPGTFNSQVNTRVDSFLDNQSTVKRCAAREATGSWSCLLFSENLIEVCC